jgi:Ni/Fe-hydrogenase subunit HybB-like protein
VNQVALRDEDAILLDPILKTGRGFYVTVAVLLALIGVGGCMYGLQWRYGLGVTGLNVPVSWGFFIINFVFFIGISHAGTLISAILRIAQAEWRRPITRMAEIITVMVISVGGLNILLDMGRPDRVLNVIYYGRYQSPLLWDATSITTYLTGSVIYLYLPLIPDIAILRDHPSRKFHLFYSVLAMGWTGTPGQKHVLERVISVLAIIVIPVAVSVHTVVAFVFSMTVQPMWHSTIFGPYFVVGAIFSGIGALIVTMVILRKVYHLESYLKEIHFQYLGTLLLVMSLLWTYFTFAEYLTAYYGHEPEEMRVFWSKFNGPYALAFWGMVSCNFLVPLVCLSFRRLKNLTGITVASAAVVVGMWLERFIIISPTLANPRLPFPTGHYLPSVVEIGEMIMCISIFILSYVLFTKLFPVVSIWEIQEGREEGIRDVMDRLKQYQPDTTPSGEGARA